MTEDLEMQAQLASFRCCVEAFKKKIPKDVTLAKVETDKLEEMELACWREYQALLIAFKNLVRDNSNFDNQRLLELFSEIEKFSDKSNQFWAETKNKFYPWLTNRIGIIYSWLELMIDSERRDLKAEGAKHLMGEYELFAATIV